MQEIQERPCGATGKVIIPAASAAVLNLLNLLNLLHLLRGLLGTSCENTETQGMGTVVRPEGPNGEVPRPLRSFCVFVERSQKKPRAWPRAFCLVAKWRGLT